MGYARCYTSEQERRDALEPWLHQCNRHRPHTACGNQPPFSRLINVPGQYNYASRLSTTNSPSSQTRTHTSAYHPRAVVCPQSMASLALSPSAQ